MFKKWFKKNHDQLVSPVTGQVVALEDVDDPVFSQKMMGEGIAVDPEAGTIVAPVSGELIQLSDTLHAFGIRSKEGAEVLVHVGLETVALKGNGFEALVKQGESVSAGQHILKADLDYIGQHAKSKTVIMVVTNSSEKEVEVQKETRATAGETVLLHIPS